MAGRKYYVADSTDPFDKRGYAWGEAPGGALMEPEVMLRPGEEKVYRTALAVADSPLAAYGLVVGLSTETGEMSGSALDPSGAPGEADVDRTASWPPAAREAAPAKESDRNRRLGIFFISAPLVRLISSPCSPARLRPARVAPTF